MNISLDAMAKKYEGDREKNLKKNESIQPKNRNNINTGGKVEGANLRETTVTESAKRTSDLNKAAKKKKDPPNAMDKYGDQLKALLSNKDKLTKINPDDKDGRNKYQIQINELKKRMKADGMKFSSLLKDVKKQEREGTFDRGAEGKAKNKLRQKMMSEKIGGSRGR